MANVNCVTDAIGEAAVVADGFEGSADQLLGMFSLISGAKSAAEAAIAAVGQAATTAGVGGAALAEVSRYLDQLVEDLSMHTIDSTPHSMAAEMAREAVRESDHRLADCDILTSHLGAIIGAARDAEEVVELIAARVKADGERVRGIALTLSTM